MSETSSSSAAAFAFAHEKSKEANVIESLLDQVETKTEDPSASTNILFPSLGDLAMPPPLDYRNEMYSSLHETLPATNDYKLYSFVSKETSSYLGAPDVNFHACFRVNLFTKEDVDLWVRELEDTSTTTWNIDKKQKVSGKKVLYQVDYYCPHSMIVKKKQGAEAVAKEILRQQKQLQNDLPEKNASNKNPGKRKNSDSATSRKKCANCEATLRISLQNPNPGKTTKKAEIKTTHPLVVKLTFQHSHPIASAHTWSFRKISQDTEQTYHELFEQNHTAATARKAYQKELRRQQNYMMTMADRAINPRSGDVTRMWRKYLDGKHGVKNGEGLFRFLQNIVVKYNATARGKAVLRPYGEESFLLAICTNLMMRGHLMPQAGEVVGVDASGGMDDLNTAVYVLATPTPAGGIPLGVIMASDETEETLRDGLVLLKGILPSRAFGGRGPEKGPQVLCIILPWALFNSVIAVKNKREVTERTLMMKHGAFEMFTLSNELPKLGS